MAVRVCHLSSVRENHDLCMFRRSCVSLAEAGYEVYLVARGDSREDMGVYVTGVGEPPRSRLRRMLFFTRRIFREALEVDAAVYQIHDPELLPFALTLKRRGKRVIFDSHEFYTELLKTKHYLPFARQTARVYGTFERYVLRRIDAVIFPATRDGKEVFSGIAQRTVTIGNYALKEELYSWYVPAEKPEFRLCFVGDMTPDRGIDNLIRAANRSGARLSLVGEFHPPSYGEAVRQMPESRCVEFLGRLDRERVREVLARSSVGMCTMPDGGQYNICDTFNMKVYDYMAMGLPVILSDSAYARQVMERYKFGILVNPADVEETVRAVRRLAEYPEEAARMGREGRRAIAEEFNWDTQVEKLLALYRDLTGGPEGRGNP
ncbi:MAG: glycosyltransferase family 4 protein [Oscillibacter sp.]|jgi:glycosyltransferase involved in cell wall biosynthesis|nr:glycosyltransferase family 4 protein [uncultured Oscillibacter sp.]MCI8812195.1 glycosyltransferase family 4 protein [Oscillibacter sp.]